MAIRNDATHPVPMRESPPISPRRKSWPVLLLLLAGCADLPVEPPRIERISAEQLQARLPPPVATVTLEAVVTLAGEGVAAEDIIARIKASGSRYRLSARQVVELTARNVPAAVLDYMIDSERLQIYDTMAADANAREMMCQERLVREIEFCRRQMDSLQWYPRHQPFGTCLPPVPGSGFWRCF